MHGWARRCWREPSLDELLADEVMEPVLRSAGYDADGLRELMQRTARRVDARARLRAGAVERLLKRW